MRDWMQSFVEFSPNGGRVSTENEQNIFGVFVDVMAPK